MSENRPAGAQRLQPAALALELIDDRQTIGELARLYSRGMDGYIASLGDAVWWNGLPKLPTCLTAHWNTWYANKVLFENRELEPAHSV